MIESSIKTSMQDKSINVNNINSTLFLIVFIAEANFFGSENEQNFQRTSEKKENKINQKIY